MVFPKISFTVWCSRLDSLPAIREILGKLKLGIKNCEDRSFRDEMYLDIIYHRVTYECVSRAGSG